ncbi:N-acetyltransferase family protein [Dactylosporangium sp. CA-233914]|uniref:GNAT family N-acetyltransferase n=1 Tax=Dactylosporangium sp. CA-233914 TaxID=3239934 RepID=UPI003D8F813D
MSSGPVQRTWAPPGFQVGPAVRPARAADLPELAGTFRQLRYFTERIARQPRLGILFVAHAGNRLAGTAFLRMQAAEEWELRQRLRGVPILSNVQVAPDLRRQGVGSAIMRAAEGYARARGRAYIALGVTATNAAARRLYAKRGYAEWEFGEVNAMVVEYGTDGGRRFSTERCLIMVKPLGCVRSPQRRRTSQRQTA